MLRAVAATRTASDISGRKFRAVATLKGQDSALRVFNLVCNVGGKICDATLGWPIIDTREDRGASVLVCAHEETATIASPETIAV